MSGTPHADHAAYDVIVAGGGAAPVASVGVPDGGRSIVVVKTYARVVTEDMPGTLDALRRLTGREPDVRFRAGETEVAAVGDFCVIGAPRAAVAGLREVVGPVVVNDLDATRATLVRSGAVVTTEPFGAPTGRVMYVRHADGVVFEYLQYTDELLARAGPVRGLTRITGGRAYPAARCTSSQRPSTTASDPRSSCRGARAP